jgi:uncharacterized repeat protein (TIGR04138 family)
MNDYIAKLREIVRADPRYDVEAYLFVNEALQFLLEKIGKKRHVTGQELLEGIKKYALQEYGPLSRNVLEHWGIHRCEDFGEIVFNMVNKNLMGKTEQDRKEDFQDGYDFEEAFERPFKNIPDEAK